jgi:energy-converting hydrogenase Eha subunit A
VISARNFGEQIFGWAVGDTIITSGTFQSVLSSLVAAVKDRRGRITAEDPVRFSFETGSRSNYRIMGMWSRALSRPVMGTVSITDSGVPGNVEVRPELASNEGLGLVEMNTLVSRQFARPFSSGMHPRIPRMPIPGGGSPV